MKGIVQAQACFFGGGLLSLAGVCTLFAGQPVTADFAPWFFAGLSAMTGGMFVLWYFHRGKNRLPTILLFGLVLRLAFLAWPHNSDLNRYVWEGRIQAVGLNPYLVAPSAPETLPWRDGAWQGVNHQDYPAVYGPLAELVFRAANWTKNPVLALKLLFAICDMGVLWLLLAALDKYGMDLRHGWLYSAHPLPALLLVGEGHLEPLLVLPLFAGFLAIHWGQVRRGLLLVGLAAAVKTTLVLLLPFAVKHLPKRQWPLVVLPFGLWLFFGSGFFAHLATLVRFAGSETFNSFGRIMGGMILPDAAAGTGGAVVFAFGYLSLWLLDGHRLRSAMLVLGLLLLCSPIVHPWYFAAILPFAVLYRSRPWLVLTTTAPLLLFVILHYSVTGQWQVPAWLTALEFTPFLAVLIAGSGRRSPLAPANFAPPTHLSVLLPVRNEAANLRQCLDAIVIPPDIPAEILVIDGGSSDDTLVLAETDPRVRTVRSAPGRGTQLAAGYRAAGGDLLVVVHADSRLGPETIPRIWHHCTHHPHVAGGACTARYRHPAPRFRVTELLNDLRVLWLGIAFGDQVQFFRRAAIAPAVFPDYRLMEDIELSLLIQHAGALTLLRTPVVASHRRWERVGYTRNTLEVVVLFTTYLTLRSIGLVRDKGEAFYRYYYGTRRR